MKIQLHDITKRFGELVAVDDISLTINDGEFLTLVGPSGCGKTTTLRMIAGLESPTEGSIVFDGEDVTNYSPQERQVAFVFQDYALYPHMTGYKNMSFALEDSGNLSSSEIEERIHTTAEMLGIEEHIDKKPSELSGGQQQRVALGRSIVRDPTVFLLDEPLSNLDAKLRVEMRAELQELHQELGTTMIYVTHDQAEAMTMSDRIAILNGGKIQQVSPPEYAYNRPVNRFVAKFVGSPSMNFLPCRRREDGTIEANPFSVDEPGTLDTDVVELGVRPEDIELDRAAADPSCEVRVFEQVGSYNLAHLQIQNRDDDLVAQVPGNEYYSVGERVGATISRDRFYLFEESGKTAHDLEFVEERGKQASNISQ
jgi:multiple sugar transport system ATP-binding protein